MRQHQPPLKIFMHIFNVLNYIKFCIFRQLDSEKLIYLGALRLAVDSAQHVLKNKI